MRCQGRWADGLVLLAALLCLRETGCDVIVYPVSGERLIVDEFGDEPARFGDALPLEGFRGFLAVGVPKDGCTALAPPPTVDNFTGKWIVLVARYGCNFDVKVRNAQDAGYDAAVVHNVNSSDLEYMSAKNAVGIRIPSVFVSDVAGYYLENNYTYIDEYYIVLNSGTPFDINTHLLLPFAVVVGLCLIIMIIFMIVKCIKDRRRARRHRLPSNALKKIPTCKYSKGDPYDTCAICLDDYLEGDKLRVLPCAHAYHCKCIDPWLTKNRRVCPVCKRRVFAAGERRARREGRRRRYSDSDSDSDDSRSPLVTPQDEPVTQGGTFAAQRENPFVRAARFMTRFRAQAAAEQGDGGATTAAADSSQGAFEAHGDSNETSQPCPECENSSAYLTAEESQQFEDRGEHHDASCAESHSAKRSAFVPFLSGVLHLRNNHFGRGELEDSEPLIPEAQSSLPSQSRAFLENERQQKKSGKSKKSRRSKSRQRSTSETPRPSGSGKPADTGAVSAEHSINRETESNSEAPERGAIGIAALPNTQFSGDPSRRDDFVI